MTPSTSRPLWWPGCDVSVAEIPGRFSHLSLPFCHAMVSVHKHLIHSWAQVFDQKALRVFCSYIELLVQQFLLCLPNLISVADNKSHVSL